MSQVVYEFRRPGWREKLIRFLADGRPVMLNVELHGGRVELGTNGKVPYVQNVKFHGEPPLSIEDFEPRGFIGRSDLIGGMSLTDGAT